MPFADTHSAQAYEHCIRPVCAQKDLAVRRADELFTGNPVWDDIVGEIQRATVVIADISGRNPNVYYELGIAHTLKQRQTIIVTHDPFTDVPFDVAHFRILRYENSIKGKAAFESDLDRTLQYILEDPLAVHAEKFAMATQILEAAGRGDALAVLLAVAHVGRTLAPNEKCEIDYEGPEGTAGERMVASTVRNLVIPALRLGFARIREEVTELTPLGEAYVTLLDSEGWKCHSYNDTIITPGHIRYRQRMAGQAGPPRSQDDVPPRETRCGPP